MSKVKVYVVLESQEHYIKEFRSVYASRKQAIEAIQYFYEYKEATRFYINEQYRWTESEDKGFWCEAEYAVERDGTANRKGKTIKLW